jgi:CheY-like chemotaxis protein
MTKPANPADVLVVDDEADIRDCLAALLKRDHHSVATAADGAQALEYLRRHPRPRLILLDLAMPGMDGWDFLHARQRRPRLRRVPVVVFSAAPADLAPEALALGVAAVFQKPIDLPAVLEVARRHCPAGVPAA